MTTDRFKWTEPWRVVTPQEAEHLEAELRREVSYDHLLHRRNVKAIARRTDRDDVLFEIAGDPPQVACVHLTYQMESSGRWPWTEIFATVEDWWRAECEDLHEDD